MEKHTHKRKRKTPAAQYEGLMFMLSFDAECGADEIGREGAEEVSAGTPHRLQLAYGHK